MAPCTHWPLLALQLLVVRAAEGSDWDSPSCTRDPLTVPRGQPAVMSCTTSTPLSHVAIRLSTPGKASQLIFGVDGPGNFSNSGWQLEVRGGEARLVIPDAQPAQDGEYTWYLVGTHRSVGHTRLSVSELVVTETESTPLPAALETQPLPPPASTTSPISVLAVIVPVLVAVIIPVLVGAVLAWRRRHTSQILQVSESAASRQPPQEEADAEEVAIPMVGLSSQVTDNFGLESEAPGGDSGPPGCGAGRGQESDRPSQGLPGPPGQSTQPLTDLSLWKLWRGSLHLCQLPALTGPWPQCPVGLSSRGLLPGPPTSVHLTCEDPCGCRRCIGELVPQGQEWSLRASFPFLSATVTLWSGPDGALGGHRSSQCCR